MARALEFVGKSKVRRDPAATEAEVRRRHPGLSEGGVMEVVRGLLFQDQETRGTQLVVHLFGADILSNDPSTIPAWPFVTRGRRDEILAASPAQRRRLIDPEGLSRTYVWRRENNWTQEVEDQDVEVLRSSSARLWFRDRERFGPFTPVNAFTFPVMETVPIQSADDLRQFRRDQKRKPMWTGR